MPAFLIASFIAFCKTLSAVWNLRITPVSRSGLRF
jgi:hypothetical protein